MITIKYNILLFSCLLRTLVSKYDLTFAEPLYCISAGMKCNLEDISFVKTGIISEVVIFAGTSV